jgi:hypothetical protein
VGQQAIGHGNVHVAAQAAALGIEQGGQQAHHRGRTAAQQVHGQVGQGRGWPGWPICSATPVQPA